jgi:putative tricarboxylic transport membrane protein
MFIFGLLGYAMRKFDLNTAAVVLALILGPIGEKGLRNALRASQGDLSVLVGSPVCLVLIALCIVGIFSPLLMNMFEKKVSGTTLADAEAEAEA